MKAVEWNGSGGGTVDQDYDNFFSQRAAQGFTVCMTDPVWTAHGASYAHGGNTGDGVTPLAGGSTDPSSAALNSTFWDRIDYMFSSAASNGITIGFSIVNPGDDLQSGLWQNSWTSGQWTSWATIIADRYKRHRTYLAGWERDVSPFNDTTLNAVYSAGTGAGDAHLWSAWYNAETTSRYVSDTNVSEDWGDTYANFNFCYSYNATYWIIEYSMAKSRMKVPRAFFLPSGGTGTFMLAADLIIMPRMTGHCGRNCVVPCQWSPGHPRGKPITSTRVADTSPGAVTGDWFFVNNAANFIRHLWGWESGTS